MHTKTGHNTIILLYFSWPILGFLQAYGSSFLKPLKCNLLLYKSFITSHYDAYVEILEILI